jgi:hypothetical protein
MYRLVSEWNLTDPFAVVRDLYQPRVTLRYIEIIGDNYCLLGCGALYPAIKWLKLQKKLLARVYGRISSLFLPEVVCVRLFWKVQYLPAFTLYTPEGGWQSSLSEPCEAHISQRADVGFRQMHSIYFSRRKSRGLTKWSSEVLLPFRPVFNDVWIVLHLDLLDIFLGVHVLHFRTASLQSGNIVTLYHRHNHNNLWNKYCCVLGLYSGLRAGPSGRAV